MRLSNRLLARFEISSVRNFFAVVSHFPGNVRDKRGGKAQIVARDQTCGEWHWFRNKRGDVIISILSSENFARHFRSRLLALSLLKSY